VKGERSLPLQVLGLLGCDCLSDGVGGPVVLPRIHHALQELLVPTRWSGLFADFQDMLGIDRTNRRCCRLQVEGELLVELELELT